MIELDCRTSTVAQAGAALIAQYNASSPGERYAARVKEWGPTLKMWLLEAGARHDVAACDDGYRVVVERSASPAQGSIPGVHHLATDGTASVWGCERGRRVARLSMDDNAVAACASVATKASHLALSADAKRIIVADPGAGKVLALDATSLAVVDAFDSPGMPQLPLITPEGIVCATGGGTGTLTIARPHGGKYRAQVVSVGRGPHDPLLSADAAHVWVPCAGSAEIVKVRLADGAIVARTPVGDGPAHLAGDARTGRIYSANSWDGTLSCLSDDGALVGTVESGRWCHAIDIAPDGSRVWAANFYDDTIAVFDAKTLQRVAMLKSGRYAHGLDASPDGRYVMATGFGADAVQLYDAQRCALLATIPVGRGSSHTVFSADGRRAYVGCSVSAHVAVLDLAARQCIGTVRLPDEAQA